MTISKIATAGFASLAMTVERGYGRIYMTISKIATAGFASLATTVERGYGRICMIIFKIVPSEGRGFSLCGTTPALSRKCGIAITGRIYYAGLAMTILPPPVIASESRFLMFFEYDAGERSNLTLLT